MYEATIRPTGLGMRCLDEKLWHYLRHFYIEWALKSMTSSRPEGSIEGSAAGIE
jgi:hypothetical protein